MWFWLCGYMPENSVSVLHILYVIWMRDLRCICALYLPYYGHSQCTWHSGVSHGNPSHGALSQCIPAWSPFSVSLHAHFLLLRTLGKSQNSSWIFHIQLIQNANVFWWILCYWKKDFSHNQYWALLSFCCCFVFCWSICVSWSLGQRAKAFSPISVCVYCLSVCVCIHYAVFFFHNLAVPIGK